MIPKLDPILGDITVKQLSFVEDQLSNNEVSSDKDLQKAFVDAGMTEAQAKQALTYRTRYGFNIYAPGRTPILAGDEAYRFNPHTRLFQRESTDPTALPEPPGTKTRTR